MLFINKKLILIFFFGTMLLLEMLLPFECKLLFDAFGAKIYGIDFEISEKAYFKNIFKINKYLIMPIIS
jgi:hypothetical protein